MILPFLEPSHDNLFTFNISLKYKHVRSQHTTTSTWEWHSSSVPREASWWNSNGLEKKKTNFPHYIIEPKVSQPLQVWWFINQVKLIIRLQPQQYEDDFYQVSLVVTLLSKAAQAWFTPLAETSPLLQKFLSFLIGLEATFGDKDWCRTSLTKLYALHQGIQLLSIYASEFRQLACVVQWDNQTLLLNFSEPTSLSQAITQVFSCDNFLFELHEGMRMSP